MFILSRQRNLTLSSPTTIPTATFIALPSRQAIAAMKPSPSSGAILSARMASISFGLPAATVPISRDLKRPKNRERRLIELFPSTVEIIQRRLQKPGRPEDFIFPGENGRPIYPTTITHAFQDLLQRLGISGHCFHDLRHTHATYLLNNHWSVAEVARRLGHKDATVTTRTYANWLPGLAGQLITQKPDIFAAQSTNTVLERENQPSSFKVGDSRFELETPVLSGLCSNQLS